MPQYAVDSNTNEIVEKKGHVRGSDPFSKNA